MFFFVKQKTAYEMRISDWSSDVCSSDLVLHKRVALLRVSTEDTPRVPLSEQLKVETLPNGFARIEIRHGFMQPVDVPETLERCRTFGLDFPPMETSYSVIRQTLVHVLSPKLLACHSQLLILLMNYALSPTEYFQLPTNRGLDIVSKTQVRQEYGKA